MVLSESNDTVAFTERDDADFRDYQVMVDRSRLRKADESGDEDLYWVLWSRAAPDPPLPVLPRSCRCDTGAEVSASTLQSGQTVILDSGLGTRRAVAVRHDLSSSRHSVIVRDEGGELDSVCGKSTPLGIGWRVAK